MEAQRETSEQEELMSELEQKVDEMVNRWNVIVELLKTLEERWTDHYQAMRLTPSSLLEALPEKGQRHLSKGFNKAQFTIAIERLVEYFRGLGGVEALYIKKGR